ncbi:CRS1 / YhbY (CRM) domain-containing protein [Actinidia rufa]|uniref:CRS1 / YhbY (CRM) domain-containing protein n=1 Tax=Actinidia rufa TaxID=165716 RepID=A0A7J0DL93_9ERIC|nr:CRS1 / YhbY (CRM) domain-containing protein [Actinidia rufa]
MRIEWIIGIFDGKAGAGTNAIERIVLRLRNLGLGLDEEERENEGEEEDSEMLVTGEEKLGDLEWEKDEERDSVEEVRKKRSVRAPTLAELTIEDEELRRLRREGMTLRERISVPKAGVTGAVLEKIYDQWRKSELVRLKFHESLAHDMKTAHEIVEVGGFDEFSLNC